MLRQSPQLYIQYNVQFPAHPQQQFSLNSVQSFVIGDERLETLSEVSSLESGDQRVGYYRTEVQLHNEKLDYSEPSQQLGGGRPGPAYVRGDQVGVQS